MWIEITQASLKQAHFEDLARQWAVYQTQTGNLPFTPEAVGSHWSRRVQIDVVAINFQSRQILLGECKWGTDPVSRQVVCELIEQKTDHLRADLPEGGQGWTIHYAFFARTGFTKAAAAELQAQGGLLVDLASLDQGLTG